MKKQREIAIKEEREQISRGSLQCSRRFRFIQF